MKRVLVAFAFVLPLVVNMTACAGEPFETLEQRVVEILKTKYPDAELRPDANLSYIHRFTANTREFLIYRTNKVGDWQKPFHKQAPDRGGISVRFYVKEGKWSGALFVPYAGTNDLHVFKETRVVRNSINGNWHIWAEILTPKVDSPEEVENELVKVFNAFEKYQE